jgi:hypothetical protein
VKKRRVMRVDPPPLKWREPFRYPSAFLGHSPRVTRFERNANPLSARLAEACKRPNECLVLPGLE